MEKYRAVIEQRRAWEREGSTGSYRAKPGGGSAQTPPDIFTSRKIEDGSKHDRGNPSKGQETVKQERHIRFEPSRRMIEHGTTDDRGHIQDAPMNERGEIEEHRR